MSNTTSRSLHDLGLAAWFGGSLMGAVGLNGAAAGAADATERSRLATDGWARWAPVNAAAIGAHLLGGAGLLAANRSRVANQQGVAATTALKTALTAAAVGVTAYSGMLGTKVRQADPVPTEGATEPGPGVPPEAAKAQQQLRIAQWAIPVLTGALLVLNAEMGEQQRPASVASGVLKSLRPSTS